MRTALITGTSRGIGRAISERLINDGVKVLTPTRAEMNLESAESIETYLSSLKKPIDVLINDAGINRVALLDNIRAEDIQTTLQVNLLAPFRLTQVIASQMCKRHYGRIVMLSSIWSVISRPGRASYTMSKTALNGLTRSLAIELARYNVLVNAVAPGYVLTDLTRQNNSEAEIEKISTTIPMGRMAEPEEIASVVSFLCSEQNTYLTGQIIIVDGGYTCL